MWKLQEAVDFLQGLDPVLREFNFCSALGGSVLHKGESSNDLDVYLMPIIDDKPLKEKELSEMLTNSYHAEDCAAVENYQFTGTRRIMKGSLDSKAIDFFIYNLSGDESNVP